MFCPYTDIHSSVLILFVPVFCDIPYLSNYHAHFFLNALHKPGHVSYSIITIIINCNWVVTRWQWLFDMYTKYEIGY